MRKDLIDKLLKASEIIANKSRSGSADWFIASPMVSDAINNLLNDERCNNRKEKIKRIFPDE